MGAPKNRAMPFESETENRFGFQSFDPNNEFVKAFMDVDLDPDPGAERRGQLAEQESSNRFNSAFTGLPEQAKIMMQGAEARNIRQDTDANRRQAGYQANLARLGQRERLLPQLVQTGGKTSGFNTQVGPRGFFGRLGDSFADSLGGFLGGGAGYKGWGG